MCAEENVVAADKLMSSGREDTKEQWDRTSGELRCFLFSNDFFSPSNTFHGRIGQTNYSTQWSICYAGDLNIDSLTQVIRTRTSI